MKVRSKHIEVKGLRIEGTLLRKKDLLCIVTNDERGKSLSIIDESDGTHLMIPFEPLEKYLR